MFMLKIKFEKVNLTGNANYAINDVIKGYEEKLYTGTIKVV